MFGPTGYFNRIVSTIIANIEQEIGGNVTIENDSEKKMIVLHWEKNPKTVHEVRYKKPYSYNEIENLANPLTIGTDFIKSQKSFEAKAEKAKWQTPKLTKVEKPKPKVIEELKVEEVEKLNTAKSSPAIQSDADSEK